MSDPNWMNQQPQPLPPENPQYPQQIPPQQPFPQNPPQYIQQPPQPAPPYPPYAQYMQNPQLQPIPQPVIIIAQQPMPGQIQDQTNLAETAKMQMIRFAKCNYVNFGIALIFAILMFSFAHGPQSWTSDKGWIVINSSAGYVYATFVIIVSGWAVGTIVRTVSNPASRHCMSITLIVFLSLMILLAAIFAGIFLVGMASVLVYVSLFFGSDPTTQAAISAALASLLRLGATLVVFIFYLIYLLVSFSMFYSKAGYYQSKKENLLGLVAPINVQAKI